MKSWFKSKTIWVNLIAALVFVLQWAVDNPDQLPWDASVVATIVAAANVVLRLVTKVPIGGKP